MVSASRILPAVPIAKLLSAGLFLVSLAGAAVVGCSPGTANLRAPVPMAQHVDLDRYMGPWFIVGAIGLSLEKGAHDAVETYTPNPDGSIATIFQFRKDAFDGFLETKPTTAWVVDGSSNAEWKVQTIWPLAQQYRIAYLEPDYSAAIVAREKRDYVWILSRDPRMSADRYDSYRKKIAAMGYDLTKFEKYPHDGSMPQAKTASAALDRQRSSAATP